MLNHAKVLSALQEISSQLFIDLSPEFRLAEKAWQEICVDQTFRNKVAEAKSPWLIPTWQEDLNQKYSVTSPSSYAVLGVDGSQIYPDRHYGVSCYLINIGIVFLRYGLPGKPVELDAHPSVYVPEMQSELILGNDLVNCKRQELEFSLGLAAMQKELAKNTEPLLFLFDGSLIFWHLEGKDETIKEHFISRYLQDLYGLYKSQALIAGYISSPKSKELVNLIRLKLCDFTPDEHEGYKKIGHLLDAHIASFFLEPGERTIVFASQSPIIQYYPEPLKPYFYYLNVGDEIVRIEVPKWVAEDKGKLEVITQIIVDQALKGRGYPVACAEAHEQAVVKGPDREFFYHLIQKMGLQGKNRLNLSQKSIKKRGMGI